MHKIFRHLIFWRSFDLQKSREKLYDSKLAFEKETAIYIVQNEAFFFLELFFGTPGSQNI